ncbi:S41 family peptidase [Bacteroides salyersiae]|uniref:S41 family peptidase n=1 Tax=Bacteroides salyersiae TaxID=291644 RepID=UPI0018972D2A|nr:S41 family peptidase [Bacteroides salyersiae]
MKKFLNRRNGIIVAIVLITVAFFSFKSGDDRNFQIAKNLDIFNSIVKELDMFYVDTIDPNKTIREGIDNMLYSLDPYTVYYPENDQDELEIMVKGSYGGIGSLIRYNPKSKYTVIAEPYEGMPAAESGLKAGDLLLEIDGKDLKGNSDVSTLLRGQVGTSFKLKVQRPGVKEPLEFNIVRRSIQMPTIPYYGVMDGQVGYINLSSFSGNPSKDFKKAFLDLKKQGITSLVIDLRNNGGGLLDQAVEIVNMFVPRGKTIVTTKGKIKQASNTYKTLREPLDTDIPIAVLVNSGTASSSEILSGSLQDLDRAVIVGNRTYGKGLVQVPRSLPYGGNLKITTSKYYIPSGRCVQAIDYAHRNEDGSVARIPDSLTTVFHTAAGREVRDGGGVSPDIEVKQERLPNILFYLVRDNLIFDYATDYCLKHPAIASAKEFELTDADYEEFKNKVKGADFKYDQQSEKILNTLKEAAEFEGYMKNASDEFKALENKLKHNLDRDLDYFSKDIKKMIAEEIIKRYYYQEGAIIQQLKDDKDLDEAVKVLTNPERYQQILSVTAVTAKKE